LPGMVISNDDLEMYKVSQFIVVIVKVAAECNSWLDCL